MLRAIERPLIAQNFCLNSLKLKHGPECAFATCISLRMRCVLWFLYGRMIWCFAAKGIVACFNLPPTLRTSSLKKGIRRWSELLGGKLPFSFCVFSCNLCRFVGSSLRGEDGGALTSTCSAMRRRGDSTVISVENTSGTRHIWKPTGRPA